MRSSSDEGEPPGRLQSVGRWLADLPGAVAELYRKGATLAIAAPAIVALALVPELAQHVAEIQLGMFLSHADFVAHQMDPLRMGFGVVKVLGMVLCMLAAARYWACDGSVKRTLLVPWRDLGRILLAIALNVAASLPTELVSRIELTPPLEAAILVIGWTFSLLLLAYLVGAVVGDRSMTVSRSLLHGWRLLPLLAILLPSAYLPAFGLHMGAHWLAISAAPALVWAVMLADAFIVGALASLVGSALYVAYARSRV